MLNEQSPSCKYSRLLKKPKVLRFNKSEKKVIILIETINPSKMCLVTCIRFIRYKPYMGTARRNKRQLNFRRVEYAKVCARPDLR